MATSEPQPTREREGFPPRVPCWIDTDQPDPEAAAAFYGGLFGWQFAERLPPDAGASYRVATSVARMGAWARRLKPTVDAPGYDPEMRVAILGASGRIGRHVLEEALEAGHEVTVLLRDPTRLGEAADRVRMVTGTVNDSDAVDRALAGAEVVISALGPDANAPEQVELLRSGMRNTIAAMQRHGVRRIVILSGAGITAPGERKPFFDKIATRIVRLFSGHVVGAKQAEYDELARTDLEWVAVRPALVTDGERTGQYVAGPYELRPGARIARADVGHLMLAQAERPTHIGHPGIFVRSS